MNDSFLIGHDTGNICLDDDAFEEIICQPKRISLGGFFLIFGHLPCGLNIHTLAAAVDDKINLFYENLRRVRRNYSMNDALNTAPRST